MPPLAILRLFWSIIVTDRAFQAGASTSGVSLFGGYRLAQVHIVQQWIAFYATVIGALGATATFVYVCIKIARMLRDPSARE